MLSATLRRAGIVLRFLFPDAQTRHYTKQIRASGLFDRSFYVVSNPKLRRLFRLAPERHYALFGEAAGLCPNPAFSPRAYLYNNPDVTAARPLLHFIETGHAEGRAVLNTARAHIPDLPKISPRDRPDPPARVAVVLHLYYHDLWPEFAQALGIQRFAFDLFVTTTGTDGDVAQITARILRDVPGARVWAMPNHGRDIFPFLHLAQSGLLAGYEAVCKLHSKRSPHRADGAAWRQDLIAGVLGPAEQTQARLERFLSDDTVGLWTADAHIHEGDAGWGINGARARDLLGRAGGSIGAGPLRFPAGSIYWIKPAVLDGLNALALTGEDFEPEQALVDGTTAHAVERLMGIMTQQAGLRMCGAQDLDTKP